MGFGLAPSALAASVRRRYSNRLRAGAGAGKQTLMTMIAYTAVDYFRSVVHTDSAIAAISASENSLFSTICITIGSD
jgi:hypothetical protein